MAALLLTGCASADPAAWQLYSKAAYTYGRMEARVEVICTPPRNPALHDFCKEAEAVQAKIRQVAPTIEAELARDRADWGAVMQYLELVLSLAAKAL